MVQFHDGQQMRLRSHAHTAFPHHGEGGEGATPGSSGVPPVRGGRISSSAALYITSRTLTDVRLRSRTHAASPDPGEGATLGARGAPPNGPIPTAYPMCASASHGGYLAAAPAEGHGYDEPAQAETVDNSSMPTRDYTLRRRRAGDDAKFSFRCGMYEWVLEAPHIRKPSTSPDVPAAAELGAAADIFVALPKGVDGVPPLLVRTRFLFRWRHWVLSFQFWCAMTLGVGGNPRHLLPAAWSWEHIARPAVEQVYNRRGEPEGSCALCSVAMCIHAQYRLNFERRHGAGSFPYQVSDIGYLKKACEKARIWERWRTGTSPHDVLGVMDRRGIGLRTETAGGRRGPVIGHRSSDQFSPLDHDIPDMAMLMRLGGTMIGALYINQSFYDATSPELVYTGDPMRPLPNHATLCVGYEVTDQGMLDIQVLDNARDGPLLWVRYEAFDRFTIIGVELEDDDRIEDGGRLRGILRLIIRTVRQLVRSCCFWL